MTARPLPPLLLRGDCIARMRDLPDASIDAVVTDPPYGLEFMGKAWDRYTPLDFEQWCANWAAETLRVLKPGGHLLAFGGSRTWHRLAAGIEDAGFEVRDSIAWLYGSGFPKSLDVSKAIDAKLTTGGSAPKNLRQRAMGDDYEAHRLAGTEGFGESRGAGIGADESRDRSKDRPIATPEAAAWQGWGTALKPAFEPIVVARKPLAGTVAANVLQYGTGALNIDASRIGTTDKLSGPGGERMTDNEVFGKGLGVSSGRSAELAGRWPANVMLDEGQAAALDAQAPKTGAAAKASGPTLRGRHDTAVAYGARNGLEGEPSFHGDTGGASRFFYVAKAPKSERPVTVDDEGNRVAHPTVKPLALMRYLVTLVTPPGGVVLDPFAGSGTTLEAAYASGFESIGVELTPDYWPLIEARIERAVAKGPSS